jgi:hypothetical protein
MTRLDKDFERVRKQVKTKMAAAAALIKEAQDMVDANNLGQADELGERGLASCDFYDAVRPLRDAMDYAGWRTSSWGC